MNGRKLIINIAINKNKAKQIEIKNLENKDKRNLYLAKEGIMLNEQEMNNMDKKELNQRINLWKNKKLKLENPNFHISKTRLSIKNIPSFINEKQLKKIFYNKCIQIREKNKIKDKNKDIYKYKFPKINQVKIVCNINKNGKKGKSKKFGFVEFREHCDSLLVLRSLNNKNNCDIFNFKNNDKNDKNNNKNDKLHIEFSIENMKKLYIHKEKTKKHKEKTRNLHLEKLKDKLEILIAQNQENEIKIVKDKIDKIEFKMGVSE